MWIVFLDGPSRFVRMKTPKEPRTVHIASFVEPSIADELARHADANGRSVSSEIRFAVRQHLTRKDAEAR